jgi:hypothetical protein
MPAIARAPGALRPVPAAVLAAVLAGMCAPAPAAQPREGWYLEVRAGLGIASMTREAIFTPEDELTALSQDETGGLRLGLGAGTVIQPELDGYVQLTAWSERGDESLARLNLDIVRALAGLAWRPGAGPGYLEIAIGVAHLRMPALRRGVRTHTGDDGLALALGAGVEVGLGGRLSLTAVAGYDFVATDELGARASEYSLALGCRRRL